MTLFHRNFVEYWMSCRWQHFLHLSAFLTEYKLVTPARFLFAGPQVSFGSVDWLLMGDPIDVDQRPNGLP